MDFVLWKMIVRFIRALGLPVSAPFLALVLLANWVPGKAATLLTHTSLSTDKSSIYTVETASHMAVQPGSKRSTTGLVLSADATFTDTLIGDSIWFDTDNDGIFDAGEQGLNNVTVALYSASATITSTPLMTTTSSTIDGRDGRYFFSGAPAGDYFVHIPAAEFQPHGPLFGFVSTGPTQENPNEHTDDASQDHGLNSRLPAQNGISSANFQLDGDAETTENESSATIPLDGDTVNLAIGFGFYQPLHIGDRAWSDNNANGLFEPQAGETGVAKIGVELYSPTQPLPLAATETDDNGYYHFEGLEPGQYHIRFITTTLPSEYQITQPAQGDDPTLDSDADPATGWVRQDKFLLSGEEHSDLDLGIFPLVSVGGRAWYDLNMNGLRDTDAENSTGIANIRVSLFYAATNQPVPNPANPLAPFTTVTDSSGRYLFNHLIPGDYYVLFDPTSFPPDHLVVPPTADVTGLNATNDSDAEPTTGRTASTGFLDGVKTELSLDIGLYSPVAVGGTIWLDANRNGVREPLGADAIRDTDDDEPGVAGVTVRVYKEGAPFVAVATTESDQNGDYLFPQLPSASYVVEFDRTTLPLGHQMTLSNVGADDMDSDAEASSGQSAPTGLLAPGQRQLSIDLGIWEPTSVAGQLWYDLNNDGIQSAQELLGQANVTAWLYNSAAPESPLYSATTNSRGQYAFNDLPPGNYVVYFDPATLPAGYQFTAQDVAGISGFYDSDVDPDTGRTGNTGFLFSGQSRRSMDAGVWLPTAVSGLAWFDNNGNGFQEPGETGVANITVTIYEEESAEPVATKQTDTTGAYRFENLPPASYYLHFEPATLPAGYGITTPNATENAPNGVDPEILDSDVNPSSGYSSSTGTLRSGHQFVRLDLGVRPLGSVRIGDAVWHDQNANGQRESNEPGIANVRVELFLANAPTTVISSTQSDLGGNYLFDPLAPGNYIVRFDPASLPPGYGFSAPQPGGSQADPQSGRTAATGNLPANAQKLDVDAGLFKPAELGGTAWTDANGNGLQQPGETGLGNVMVALFHADGSPTGQTTTTGIGGSYLFTDLLPGAYFVRFELPKGHRLSPANAQIITRLQDENALLADEVDSDADDSGSTPPVTIASGERNTSLDMGAYPPLRIGDQVWFDANNNGRKDNGEGGLDQVKVQLLDLQNRIVATTTTAANGFYLFENLPTGDYVVLLPGENFALNSALFEYFSSVGHDGSLQETNQASNNLVVDLGVDSLNPAQTGIRSPTIRLQPSSIDQSFTESLAAEQLTPVPLGFYKPLNIGNRVWLDQNNSGQIDADEPGIENVLVQLYRDENGDGQPDGPVLREQRTTSGGYYLFDNLGAGHYVIHFPFSNFQSGGALAGMASSAPNLDNWVETTPVTQTVWVDRLDNQDDGRNSYTPWISGVRSGVIELAAGQAPLAEADQHTPAASTVHDENSNLTVDFGFYTPLSLGSRIWLDLNHNEQFEPDEPGIEDVLLLLFQDGNQDGEPDGAPIAQTTTAADGAYRFWGLLPGGYLVEVASQNFVQGGALSNFYLSGAGSATPENELVRSMPVWLSAEELPIQGASVNPSGQSIFNINSLNIIDFGFYEPVEVSGRIWLDGNANGLQDLDENNGPANILVTLYSVNAQSGLTGAVRTTTTNSTGRYRFAQLLPGEYTVGFDLDGLARSGYTVTAPRAAGVDGKRNSDADPVTGETAATSFLTSGATETALDLGVYTPASLGDLVWYDANRNGIYEPTKGEKGVAGVHVLLYQAGASSPMQNPNAPGTAWSSTTDLNGRYQFSNLTPGSYFVQFVLSTLPAGHLVSPPNQGGDDLLDSDADPATGVTQPVPLSDGGALNTSLDLAIYSPISVGDRVWFDDNANGIQDPGESGVPGVRATLYSTSTNAPVADPANPGQPLRAVTDEAGHYLFANLPSDGYSVQFDLATLPAGYQPSAQHAGGSNSIDSDAEPQSGHTSPTGQLQAGDAWLTLDMGIWAPASLGDRVWFDLNANGIQDAGEPGVANVLVHLLDDQKKPTGQSTRTDENGRYLFDNLPLGRYAVQFDLSSLPAGHAPTQPKLGGNDVRDSDADPQSGQTPLTPQITSGQPVWGLDMGVVGVVSIGDRVWLDANRNGIQDEAESGVEGITVKLLKSNGEAATHIFGDAVAPAITAEQGEYRFDNLPPGAYLVQFDLATLPPHHVVSAANQGANDALDSDASPSNGRSGATNFLPGGFSDFTLDMGIHRPAGARIGDFVWEDLNANGLQDWGEPGVAGVAVELYVIDVQGNGAFTGQSRTTDASGAYLFDELPPGQYYVRFDLETLPVGYRVTSANAVSESADALPDHWDSDADPLTGETPTTAALDANGQETTLDMGIFKSAELGGRVWLDSDGDGAQDAGEFGVRDLEVSLLDANGDPTGVTLLTGLDGRYVITDLAPGDYYVQFELPTDYAFSTPNQGRSRTNDSDVDVERGHTSRIRLQSGQSDLSWSAGMHKGAAVGNYIWYDGDGDGLQGEDELSIFGVTVQLYSSAGELLRETISDGSGLYGFSELEPGEYYVLVAPPTGFVLTHPLRGADSGLDSNIDPKTGRSDLFALQAGRGNPTIDAGLTLAASIGNFVWYDRNANGYKDVSEDGVGGIEVILYDENSEAPRVLSSVLTDANGFYQFTGLLPGRYSLQFVRPTTFGFTEPDGSNLGTLTSKADPRTGRTAVTVLEPAENDAIWGAGLVAAPGAVSLVSFRATLQQGASGQEISVDWVTSAELDTFGFHIYLGTDETFGSARQMSSQMILGEGSDGGVYHFSIPYNAQKDPPISALAVWLVETELDGSLNYYGPTRVIDPASLKRSTFLPLVIR